MLEQTTRIILRNSSPGAGPSHRQRPKYRLRNIGYHYRFCRVYASTPTLLHPIIFHCLLFNVQVFSNNTSNNTALPPSSFALPPSSGEDLPYLSPLLYQRYSTPPPPPHGWGVG